MRSFFILLWTLACLPVMAGLKLAPLFTDHLVLQQDTLVKVWGIALSGQTVTVSPSWLDSPISVQTDENGHWCTQVRTLAADNLSHSIRVSCADEIVQLKDVVFGEVWFCSGQSNMEMKLKGYYGQAILTGPRSIMNARNDMLRICEVKKQYALEEQTTCNLTGWRVSVPEVAADCSAAAYFFGRQLQASLGIPVGLIIAPWGGADIVAFMSGRSIEKFSEYKIPQSKAEVNKANVSPTVLYNAMIHPCVGYGMRGVLWYQGETNRKTPELYRRLFKEMVTDWRQRWDIGEFPFYFAQVAPFDYPDGNSAYLREAQLLCEGEVANTGMVCLLDCGEEKNIHPADKLTVGERFAAIALDRTYGVAGVVSRGPSLKSVEFDGPRVVLTFDFTFGGLTTCGNTLDQFEVAGSDKVFYKARAVIRKSQVVVTSTEVEAPVAVRYGFTDYVRGSLYNVAGWPASSFRTDTW